jgi:tRNA (adenine57-N1/adenine58-N1)-methyltransferase catalytic subunit
MNFSDSAVQSYDGKIMKYGDLVLLYEGHGNLSYIYLQKGVILNNKFGAFHHHTFVDKPYGSKILSHNKHSFIYALQCTPELWTYALHTRTQIVDSVDSSIVTTALDLFPGCVVAESGTGSGCMTMALARCVSPNGRVFSYEYNSTRAQTASDEFKK